MMALLPSLFLLFIAAVVVILHRSQRTVGYAWVAAVIGSLLVWFSLIVARFQPPFSYIQPAWQPADNTEILIAFQLDSFSWA
ncbi:MAG: hypothetical protein HPY76_08275, partial [Anaerolineae bacterium]|nr:hypothetical protein [Anaerolineae bacterium]